MVRYKNVSHGKKLWYTYICPGHADDPARCPFVSIREDELNEVLFTAIQSQIQLAADLEEVVKRLNAQPEFRRQRSDATAKLEAARRTLRRSQSLYDKNAKRMRAEKGLFLSPFAPYGYVKDPEDKNRLLIDKEAADIVRKIFALTIDGVRPTEIAAIQLLPDSEQMLLPTQTT